MSGSKAKRQKTQRCSVDGFFLPTIFKKSGSAIFSLYGTLNSYRKKKKLLLKITSDRTEITILAIPLVSGIKKEQDFILFIRNYPRHKHIHYNIIIVISYDYDIILAIS